MTALYLTPRNEFLARLSLTVPIHIGLELLNSCTTINKQEKVDDGFAGGTRERSGAAGVVSEICSADIIGDLLVCWSFCLIVALVTINKCCGFE